MEKQIQKDPLFVVNKKLADAIYVYLSERPCKEVRHFVSALENLPSLDAFLEQQEKMEQAKKDQEEAEAKELKELTAKTNVKKLPKK